MKSNWLFVAPLLLLLLLAGLGARQALSAPPGGVEQAGYDLSWWTVDGGGLNPVPGSGYRLGGTAGQPDAGLWQGGGYTLGGGFWGGGAVAHGPYEIYLPLVLRGY